ncbi:MAG: P-type conjugative transfer ATPase TrbB [Shewanella sp.]
MQSNSHINSIKTHFGQKQLELLNDDDVTELMLNSDGNLWVERFGLSMQIESSMTPTQAMLLMKALAGFHSVSLTAEQPLLECEFPVDGSRFEGVIPPVVLAPTFALRKKAIRVFSLDDYMQTGMLSKAQCAVLRQAITERKNILIVGGTGSGKTTFANALINEMVCLCHNDRIVIIEDTNEIQCAAQNSVILRSNATTSMANLLRATLRLRPDRILVGEVRGGEALSLLKAWNTGHSGGIATIHANSARLGLIRLGDCIAEVSQHINHTLISQTVNLVVFIEKSSTGRSIKEIIQVHDFVDGQYVTSTIES